MENSIWSPADLRRIREGEGPADDGSTNRQGALNPTGNLDPLPTPTAADGKPGFFEPPSAPGKHRFVTFHRNWRNAMLHPF
jgi:hypothetical protein